MNQSKRLIPYDHSQLKMSLFARLWFSECWASCLTDQLLKPLSYNIEKFMIAILHKPN